MQPYFELYFRQSDTWRMEKPHFHEDVELLLSLSEGGDFFIDDQLYRLHYGGLFLLPEATLHKSVAQEAYRRYILHVPPGVLRALSTAQTDFTAALLDGPRSLVLSEGQTSALLALLARLETPLQGGFGADIRRTLALTEFLLAAFSLFTGGEDAPHESGGSGFRRVQPIVDYIQRNLASPLSLDHLAAQFYMSKYYLCRIFKAATGFSIMEYIIYRRVLRARELLREGARVQEAGEAVGFQSNAHFIRTFNALTGTSPKRYATRYLAGRRE